MEWSGLEFGKSQRAVENREKWGKLGCKIICCAPTALVVKGLMMMMMKFNVMQKKGEKGARQKIGKGKLIFTFRKF